MIRKQSPRLCRGIERVGARQSCCTRQKRNKSTGGEGERERKGWARPGWAGLGPLNICLEACTLWGFDCFGTRVEDRFNDRRPIPLRKSRARICSERWADRAHSVSPLFLGPGFFSTITRIFWEFFWTRLKQHELFLRVCSGKKFEEKLLFVSLFVSHDTIPSY